MVEREGAVPAPSASPYRSAANRSVLVDHCFPELFTHSKAAIPYGYNLNSILAA